MNEWARTWDNKREKFRDSVKLLGQNSLEIEESLWNNTNKKN